METLPELFIKAGATVVPTESDAFEGTFGNYEHSFGSHNLRVLLLGLIGRGQK